MNTRRTFLQRTLALGSAILGSRALTAQGMQMPMSMPMDHPTDTAASTSHARTALPNHTGKPIPVIAPDVGDLPYTLDSQTKVFHLVAEPIQQTILPGSMGKTLNLWGFNGSAPGPTIQVTEGDHVRVIVDNHLPEPTSMHWHGFEDTIANDGMPGISQPLILPGDRFVYEFHIHQTGTFFYHSHMAMQELTGLLGGFIMHPRKALTPAVDKDYLLHLQEYAVLPNLNTPNTMNMEFNWLVLNGKSGPATTPLLVRLGDRVRIRFVNMGMDHHPMHLHGNTFHTTGTEAGRIPESAWWPGNTVLVGVAQARDIEFVASNPGDWMLHCHLPHHMMNQMSSNVGKMTRPAGQPAGLSMESGMGMLQNTSSSPLGEDSGPSLGRGLGVGSTSDMQTTNNPIAQQSQTPDMPGMVMTHSTPQSANASTNAMQMPMPAPNEIAPNATSVPNFPQDAYMESPAMAMDTLVDRPENHGLRPGWSAAMMGMMTFVRVLPPAQYDAVLAKMQKANRPNDPYAPLLANRKEEA